MADFFFTVETLPIIVKYFNNSSASLNSGSDRLRKGKLPLRRNYFGLMYYRCGSDLTQGNETQSTMFVGGLGLQMRGVKFLKSARTGVKWESKS